MPYDDEFNYEGRFRALDFQLMLTGKEQSKSFSYILESDAGMLHISLSGAVSEAVLCNETNLLAVNFHFNINERRITVTDSMFESVFNERDK